MLVTEYTAGVQMVTFSMEFLPLHFTDCEYVTYRQLLYILIMELSYLCFLLSEPVSNQFIVGFIIGLIANLKKIVYHGICS